MKILIVSDAFWPDDTGGITKSLLTEVEGLVGRGHQVTIITRRLQKSLPSYQRREGYDLYRYLSPVKGSASYRTYPFFSLIRLPKLAIELHRNLNFDMLYTHNPFQFAGLNRAHLGIPIVHTFYAPAPREIEIDAKRGKYGLIGSCFTDIVIGAIKRIESQALCKADVILVRSKFIEREMYNLYGDVTSAKVRLIPLAVDTARFKFASEPKAIRRDLGLLQDHVILLTVRRLVARMGLENLIDAMKCVVECHPEVVLLIAGSGYLDKEFRERIHSQGLEQHVQLLGFIPEEKLPSYYQAADLFILPTTELEGFGLATIEALSCGTLVIATPIGANPEVVGPLGSELLCKDATAKALAERINWWLDRGISAEVRQACREYCVSRFAVESVVASLEQIFTEAIRPKVGKR